MLLTSTKPGVGIDHVFSFGKFKGKKFSEIVFANGGPGWLCWLRTQKEPGFFNDEANMVIDECIRNSPTLRKHYKPLESKLPQPKPSEESIGLKPASVQPAIKKADAYKDQWGAW